MHLFVNKEWKHDVQNQIKVPNLGSLQQPDYWQPMDIYQGLAVQGTFLIPCVYAAKYIARSKAVPLI